MNTPRQSGSNKRAFTLLEMSIVIMVLLSLVSVGLFSSKKMGDWKVAREASEALRAVYTAQRMFLADHPTTSVANITATSDPTYGIIPYLPGGLSAVPTVKALDGKVLTIIVNQSPPRINAGSGVVYDPSGSNTDSLWDVGE